MRKKKQTSELWNVMDEEVRILKLLYRSDWLKQNGTVYELVFDTDNRDLTERALPELLGLVETTENFFGVRIGFTFIDGYCVGPDNRCALLVKTTPAARNAMKALLRSLFAEET